MSAPSEQGGGFICVRLANLGSGHTACGKGKSFLLEEGTHLDSANEMAFKYLYFDISFKIFSNILNFLIYCFKEVNYFLYNWCFCFCGILICSGQRIFFVKF